MTYSGLFRAWATMLAAILAAILLTTAAFATGAGAGAAPLLGAAGRGSRPRRNRLGGGKHKVRPHRDGTGPDRRKQAQSPARSPARRRRLHGVHDAYLQLG